MRLLILLPAALYLSFFLGGCAAYRDDRTSYSWRSEHFQSFLGDKNAIEAFRKGDTNAVALYIEKRTVSDANFSNAYQKILAEEGIRFFSPSQTSQYFYKSIHILIPK
jgi:hypothetical protein